MIYYENWRWIESTFLWSEFSQGVEVRLTPLCLAETIAPPETRLTDSAEVSLDCRFHKDSVCSGWKLRLSELEALLQKVTPLLLPGGVYYPHMRAEAIVWLSLGGSLHLYKKPQTADLKVKAVLAAPRGPCVYYTNNNKCTKLKYDFRALPMGTLWELDCHHVCIR